MNEKNEALRVFPHDKRKEHPSYYASKIKVIDANKENPFPMPVNKGGRADIFKKRYN